MRTKRKFHKGVTIAPREHVEEWTRWGLVVENVYPDGSIDAYSIGGGFVHKFSPERVEFHDFIVVPNRMLHNPTWYYAEFWADWVNDSFKAWTTGELWNGWGMPRFEFHEAMRYARATESSRTAQRTRYDRVRNAFVTQMEEWEEVDAATTITVPDGRRITVYPVGAGSWTWDEREKTEYQEGRSVKDWTPED